MGIAALKFKSGDMEAMGKNLGGSNGLSCSKLKNLNHCNTTYIASFSPDTNVSDFSDEPTFQRMGLGLALVHYELIFSGVLWHRVRLRRGEDPARSAPEARRQARIIPVEWSTVDDSMGAAGQATSFLRLALLLTTRGVSGFF